MNKKFLSAILFGALMVTSTGTFVSCKDYDDDIDQINSELADVKSQIAALQAKVDAGKWITSATTTAEGVTLTLSDGSSLKITNGKDGENGKDGLNGAAGEAGAPGKDGKDGSVVEVKEGVLYINGEATAIKVCEEAPAALPCVKVEAGELMILQADGTYAASGIEVGCVTAAKVNGLWTITVGDDVITVPGSAAMSYIDILNGSTNMKAIYAINKEDVAYGENGEKTLAKGLYTTLDRNLQIVVNPQGTDASVYDFSLMNSENVNTELKFKDAVPYEGLLTRASSENAVWVLEHDFTRYEDITDARTKNYLLFKSNDGSRHALTLSATSGETTVKTPYNLGATLQKLGKVSVYPNSMLSCLVNEVYTPDIWTTNSVNAAGVYDYWLTIEESANNLKDATLYGVEIVNDGHAVRYTRETGVKNSVVLRYNYILIDGTIVKGDKAPTFRMWMEEEMASANTIVLERLETPLDAKWNKTTGMYEMSRTYSLADLTAEMSDVDKLVWKAGLVWSKTLIGGEGNNNADWINNELAYNRISHIIDFKKNEITFIFGVKTNENNFYLNNAYELTLTGTDPSAMNTVATIVLPFEFTQPTLDITRVNGEKAIWNKNVLSLYGDYIEKDGTAYMYAPLYEAFDGYYGYDAKGKFEWTKNAYYYTLNHTSDPIDCAFGHADFTVLGKNYENELHNIALAGNLTITSKAAEWGAAALASNVGAGIPVEADYTFYGVYPATEEQVADFTLRFASLLGDAQAVETVETSYTANNVTREVILTDEDFNLVDALGSAFFLFDGVKADGNIDNRSDMNLRQGFEEGSEGFATTWTLVSVDPIAYYTKNGVETKIAVEKNANNATLVENTQTKTRNWEAGKAHAEKVLVTMLPATQAWKSKGYDALAGGVQIQLPTSVGTTEAVTVVFTLEDVFGVQKQVKVVVKAAK